MAITAQNSFLMNVILQLDQLTLKIVGAKDVMVVLHTITFEVLLKNYLMFSWFNFWVTADGPFFHRHPNYKSTKSRLQLFANLFSVSKLLAVISLKLLAFLFRESCNIILETMIYTKEDAVVAYAVAEDNVCNCSNDYTCAVTSTI